MLIYWHNMPFWAPMYTYLCFGSQYFMNILTADWTATAKISHSPPLCLRWRCSSQWMSSVFICIIPIHLFHRLSPEPDAIYPQWDCWTYKLFLLVPISPCLARHKRLCSLLLNEESGSFVLSGLPLYRHRHTVY